MNQPKPRQIRLPFSVPKPGRTKGQSRPCGICRNVEGKYTCPRCNLVYCSLECFRDKNHTQCSESFYKTTVMDQIASDPQAGMDEKKAMIEMLRRFEGQTGESGSIKELGPEEGDENDEEDELEKRMRDVDLENIDSNKLFHLLPQEHRDAFIAAIRDPDSEAGRELLESAGDGNGHGDGSILPSVLPWWESTDIDDELDEDNEGLEYAEAPELVSEQLLAGVVPPEGVGRKLVFNALAICVAYLHTLLSFRLPSLDKIYLDDSGAEVGDIKSEVSRLVPFLVDQKSTVRFTTTREAYSNVWEQIGADQDPTPSTTILIRLLNSLIPLTHPPITTDPPRIHLVLSNLHHTFARPKVGPAARKLLFYLAALRRLDRQDWLGIENELRKEVEKLEAELGEEESDVDEPSREHLLL